MKQLIIGMILAFVISLTTSYAGYAVGYRAGGRDVINYILERQQSTVDQSDQSGA